MSLSLTDLLPAPDTGSTGDELCVHDAAGDASKAQVHAGAHWIAAALREAGVRPGDRVAAQLTEGRSVAMALFGVWLVDAVYVPVNPRATERERASTLASTDAVAIVTDLEGSPAVTALERNPAAGSYGDDVAIVSFTSGTTGEPKPVPLTHGRVLSLMDKVIGTLRTKPAGGPPMPNLIPVPMSTWAGIYQLIFAFRVGAPVVILERFDTKAFAELVTRFAIRSTVLPPAAMVMLVDDPDVGDLAPLRYVRSISSPLSPLSARRFKDRFGIAVLNGWGQTELGGEVVGWTAADSKEFADKLGSVGRPHPGVEVRTDTIDPRDSGELLVRTAGMVPGADLGDRLLPDGWVRTGDIGRVDEDGFVWLEGRVSDMINRGGLKVHPAEVEEVLRLSPAISDACVLGAADDRLGEVPWAFCVPEAGSALPSDDELVALCRAHLAPYKVPVRFVGVDALPRNDVGKVLRRDLLAQLTEEDAKGTT